MVEMNKIDNFIENISWLGHDSFLIKANDKNIFIDPYNIHTKEKADLILISHSHYDHYSPDDIEKIRTDKTIIITESETASKISDKVLVMKPNDILEENGIKIEATHAYNINKEFHTKEKEWLGFIITIDNIRIYHAGDTDLIEEMNDIKTDIALLPVSGTYVMTAKEAIEATKIIKPKIAIPMHYGSIVGDKNDAILFANGLKNICKTVIMETDNKT